MLQSITRSTQQLPNIRRKKRNVGVPEPAVFQLVNQIPPFFRYFNAEGSFPELLSLAKNLTTYCKISYPEAYQKLSFDLHQDDVLTFCGAISNLIFEQGTHIGIQREEPDSTFFLFEIDFDAKFYILEAKFFETMPNEALKIGFAHLISRFQQYVPYATLLYLSDDRFSGHFLEPDVDYYIENHEEGSPEYQEHEKEVALWAKTFHKASEKIAAYAAKDLSLFYKYVPKKEHTKMLKKLLLQGLDLNLNVLYRFANSEPDDDGCLGYMEFFGVLYDMDNILEQQFFDNKNEHASQIGISMPCGFHKYSEGKKVDYTTQKDYSDFTDICQFLETFITYLYS